MTIFCCFTPRRPQIEPIPPQSNPSCASPLPTIVSTPPSLHSDCIPLPPLSRIKQSSDRSMPIHELPTELGELVVNDSDSEDEKDGAPSTKGSGALSVVKTRIIRHLSQDLEHKRKSYKSVGQSEVEVARRVELKRIMRRRIQDELRSEERQSESSGSSSPSNQYRTLMVDNAILGPRDTIEFSVVDAVTVPESDEEQSQPASVVSDPASNHNTHHEIIPTRPESCPAVLSGATDQADGIRHQVMTDRTSLPDMPPSPRITATQPPSVHDEESLHSWRLSYASVGNLDNCLTVDLDTSFANVSSQSHEGQSALGTWLLAQDFHSAEDSVILSPPLSNATLNVIDKPDTSIPRQHSNKSSETTNSEVHLYEMNISSELASVHHESIINLPQHSASSIVVDENLDTASLTTLDPTENASSSSKVTSTFKPACDQPDASSSVYPSAIQSLQASPADSSSNFCAFSLDEETIRALQLSPFEWSGRFSLTNDNLTADFTFEEKPDSSQKKEKVDVVDSHLSTQPMTTENSSMAVSETSSFRHREVELRSIETRFADVLALKRIPANTVSKFTEDFGSTENKSIQRSFFSRIHMHNTKGEKNNVSKNSQSEYAAAAEEPTDDHNVKLVQNFISNRPSNMSLYTYNRASHTTNSEDDTSEKWQHAFRSVAKKQKTKKARGMGSGTLSNQKHGNSGEDTAPRCQEPRCQDVSTVSCSEEKRTGLTPLPDEISVPDVCAQPESFLKRWASYRSTRSAGDTASNTKQHAHVAKLTIPPRSWAQWSSHSRTIRIGSAGSADGIKHTDFAVRSVSPGGVIEWHTDRYEHVARPKLVPSSRTLSDKFGIAVKSTFNKLVNPKAGTSVETVNTSVTGREGSWKNGQLEYPELEILPTRDGYKDLQALEREIDQLKGHKPCAEEAGMSSENGFSAGKPGGLSNNLSRLFRQAEHRRQHAEELSEHVQRRPITPANQFSLSVEESNATTSSDAFVTPLSHISGRDDSPSPDLLGGGKLSIRSGECSPIVRRTQSATTRPSVKLSLSNQLVLSRTQSLLLQSCLGTSGELQEHHRLFQDEDKKLGDSRLHPKMSNVKD